MVNNDRMFNAVLAGEFCLLVVNCYSLIFLKEKDFIAAAAVLVAYRVFFLWALANRYKYCTALYGIFSSVFVARNILLLGSMFIYLMSHGIRVSDAGEIFTGGSSISKFGLITLILATVVRMLGLGWVVLRGRIAPPRKTNLSPAATLVSPVIMILIVAIIEHGLKSIHWLLLYDLMIFYRFGIFL